MSIITLTTDWKFNDYYAGAVKGCILSHSPGTTVIDLNHQIHPFNTAQAAFILKNSFAQFPKGTIHIVDVNSECTVQSKHIALQAEGHYFIGTDNGGFGLIFNDHIENIVQVEKFVNDDCHTFPALHVFAPAAAFLANGNPINELGARKTEINRQSPMLPTIGESVITGSVVFIDAYQNAITNITRELFEQIGNGRKYEIFVQSNHYKITRINKTYNETSSGELLAIFNSVGLLEIAINKGNAAELLNLGINSNVRVKFMG